MVNVDKSITEGFYFDCKTPRKAAIKNLVIRENNCEYQEAGVVELESVPLLRIRNVFLTRSDVCK